VEALEINQDADNCSPPLVDHPMLRPATPAGLVRVCCAMTRLVQGLTVGIPLTGQDLWPLLESCHSDASRNKGVELGLGVRGSARIGATIAGCALVAACTPEQPPATPTPSSTAAASPTASASPTETDIERRMRLDFEAAERAYRANVLEQDRQAQLGIAVLTPVLRQTSTAEYLNFSLSGLRDIKKSGWHAVGKVRIVGVARGGWKEERLTLIGCEDGSGIKLLDKNGSDVTPKVSRRFVQRYTVTRVGSLWKLSDLESKRVQSFQGAECLM
jgi:hypothetical protein